MEGDDVLVEYCPTCKTDKDIKVTERKETHQFKSDMFEVLAKVAVCAECNEDVPNEKLDSETLLKLSLLYEEKHSNL